MASKAEKATQTEPEVNESQAPYPDADAGFRYEPTIAALLNQFEERFAEEATQYLVRLGAILRRSQAAFLQVRTTGRSDELEELCDILGAANGEAARQRLQPGADRDAPRREREEGEHARRLPGARAIAVECPTTPPHQARGSHESLPPHGVDRAHEARAPHATGRPGPRGYRDRP